VDTAGQDGWKRAFGEWLDSLGVREHTGSLLEYLEPQQAESTAAAYILHLIENKGKRAEQLTQMRSMGKAVFDSDRGQGDIWNSPIVTGAAQTGRRSDDENREQHEKRLRNTKYGVNYGVMWGLLDSLGIKDIDWGEEMHVRKGNAVVEALMCFILFDMGPRKGNVGGKAKTTRQEKKAEEALQAKRNLERALRDIEDPGGATKRDDEEQERMADSHKNCAYQDWEFFVRAEAGEEGPKAIRGGTAFTRHLKEHDNSCVVKARAYFVSTKVSGKSMKADAKSTLPATIGRRTELEVEFLELLLNFLRWNDHPDGALPLLWRRPTKGSTRAKFPVVTPVTDRLKRLARENGVAASHAAASSFRKGYASAMQRMNRTQRNQDEEQLKKTQNRGGNWVEGSEVTGQHYMYDENDKGPLALVNTWKEALEFGGGWEDWRERQGAIGAEVQG
jgi:hypothetical protein